MADKEVATRIYILRPRELDEAAGDRPRLVDAKSETAAMLYIAGQLYTVEAAKPRDVQAAYEAGAKMEHAAQ